MARTVVGLAVLSCDGDGAAAPTSVFVWTTRTGGVQFDSRSTRFMGYVQYAPHRYAEDNGTCWRPGDARAGERLVRSQGLVSRVGMWTGGIVIRAWIVAAGGAAALEHEVDVEWQRGQISWWARAVVQFRNEVDWPAVALNDGDAARRIGSRLAGSFVAHLDDDVLRIESGRDATATYTGAMSFASRPVRRLTKEATRQ